MMHLSTTENTLKARHLGIRHDAKRCFETRDEYFACLDSQPYEKENPYKCGSLLSDWRRFCEAGIRKYQVEERALNKRNESLYTQKQLDEYNKFKNDNATKYSNI
mmetsp:Transcript_24940/g.29003  ORF Transcript_24940/g.29003 Transcript_24940/m.29003 type:complete len:105 (-) Transcript_24940:243-557(-)